MSVRADPEQVETTRSEKALAVVLAVFILIGGIWGYFKLDEVDQPATRGQLQPAAGSSADREAVKDHQAAASDIRAGERAVTEALRGLELEREAFRTALEAGEPSDALRLAYERAQRNLAAAQRAVSEAEQRAAETAGAASAAQARIDLAQRKLAQELDDDERSHDRLVFALRLALVLFMLGGGYWLLGRMRRRRSRYLPLALAEIGGAAALALVMATDYTTDRIDVEELGPLALSLAGMAMTVASFVALQRYVAKRIPRRRVRRHECPFCGFPVRDNANCEGCGRRVIGECTACHGPRRVGAEHCGLCGAT